MLKKLIEFIELWKLGAFRLFLIVISIISPVGFLVPLSIFIIPLVMLNVDISLISDNLDFIGLSLMVILGPYMLAKYWDNIE